MIKLTTLTFLLLASLVSYSQCTVTTFNVIFSSCKLPSNTYNIDGTIGFVNSPNTGVLTVSLDDGINVYDTIINAPFVTNVPYSISNLPANGNAVTVSVTFSDDLSCSTFINSFARASCACVADIGTFSYASSFSTGNSHFITDSIPFSITGNLDHTFSDENPNGGALYDTAMGYIAFNCQTTGIDLFSDPCLIGFLGTGTSYSVSCADMSFGLFPNPVYIMPITMYDATNNIYSNTNTGFYCYDIGTPQEVYCLSPILVTPSTNPANGQISFQISGGLPAYHNSNYTISNVLPVSAVMDVSSVPFNGTTVLSGLLDGEAYSFTVADSAGNEKLISNTYSSVDDNFVPVFSFFPNPVKDIVSIKGINELTLFTITTLSGQIVFEKELGRDGVLQLNELTAGFYLLSGANSRGNSSLRLIKY